jgi:hypothetical protein
MSSAPGGLGRLVPPPNVAGLVFLFLVLLVPAAFSHNLLNLDGDVARHLVLGRHVVEQGVVFADPFSHTRAGETFTAYEWLSEVIFAGAEGLLGLSGVVVLAGLVITSSLTLVAVHFRGRLEPVFAVPAVFLAAVLTAPHWVARPHLFSFLCISVLLLLVSRRPDPHKQLGIVVLFALWANLHPGFLYGLAILGAYLVGDCVDHPARAPQNAVSVAAAFGGTLINPLGWGLHVSIIHHLKDQRAFELVDEFAPLDLTSVWGGMTVSVMALLVFLVVRGWRRGRSGRSVAVALTLGAAVAAAVLAKRNIPLMALFAFPLTLTWAAPLFPTWRPPSLQAFRDTLVRDDRRGTAGPWVAIGTVVVLLLAALSERYPGAHPSSAFSAEVFPVEGVAAARQAGLDEIRMFNAYAWGGYILHAWPEQRIYIDGMANFFGSDLMEEYLSVMTATQGWQERLREREIGLLIVPPNAALAHEAEASTSWRVFHRDATAVILVRIEDEARRLDARFERLANDRG